MAQSEDDLKRRVFTMMGRFKQERYYPFIMPDPLTPSESKVIIAIHLAKQMKTEPIQPNSIAKVLNQSPSALSQTLKILDENGYIERHRMSNDSRAVSLELTEKGKRLAEEADRMRDEHLDELFGYIGTKNIEHLVETLERILDFYQEQAKSGKVERIENGHCGRVE